MYRTQADIICRLLQLTFNPVMPMVPFCGVWTNEKCMEEKRDFSSNYVCDTSFASHKGRSLDKSLVEAVL
jgi:hypothetical protein